MPRPYVAFDQGYLAQEAFDAVYALCSDIGRLLTAFIAYLERHPDGKPSSVKEEQTTYGYDPTSPN